MLQKTVPYPYSGDCAVSNIQLQSKRKLFSLSGEHHHHHHHHFFLIKQQTREKHCTVYRVLVFGQYRGSS